VKPTAKMPEEWRLRPQERNGWPKTLTAAELLGLELPPIRWSVAGLLPEGVTLLAGKPKVGKSWMALGIAIAISTGGVALGTRPVEMGDVLYMALEDNYRRLRKRLEKLLTNEAPERLHIVTQWPRMDEGGAEALERWLEAHPDTRLVVVDILKRVRPRTSPNRSVYEADYEALEAMQRLAAEFKVSILVVHHLRKQGAADPLDEISGSTGLSGGADGVLVLKRDRGRADAYLHVTGREIEEEAELALRWDADLASWTLVGDAEEYRISKERQDIVRVLTEAEEPMAPKEVADLLDKSVNAVKYLMWRMSKDGQLATAGKGRYSLTANPANPLTANPGRSDESVSAVSEVSSDAGISINEDEEAEF
jgi:AAA domain